METWKLERSTLLAEVQTLRNELSRKDVQIQLLEGQLSSLCTSFERETEARETQTRALFEQVEALNSQLGDITKLLRDLRADIEQNKVLTEERIHDKANKQQEKEARLVEIRDTTHQIHVDLLQERKKAEEAKSQAESKPSIQDVIEELKERCSQQQELLKNLFESWHADSARQNEDTIKAVRSTAQEVVPFNVQGYLDEFSKALSMEVRMLLEEVGKLHEERRSIQYELGDLLVVKSKYGPGGEFTPDWKPRDMTPNILDAPRSACVPQKQPQKKVGWWFVFPFGRKRKEAALSSALAAEVGQLFEERRSLQHELGYLLSMMSKYSPGGMFQPDWTAPTGVPASPSPQEPRVLEQPPGSHESLRTSGWRSVVTHKRQVGENAILPVPPASAPAPNPGPPVQPWATWQPWSALTTTPPPSTAAELSDPNRGLFGPRTPDSSSIRLPQ